MSKLTDYGLVLMAHLANQGASGIHSARTLSDQAHLPVPTVNKLLKLLAAAGLLLSHRGIRGGYRLARRPAEITAAEIIAAIEGPIGLTGCAIDGADECAYAPHCLWKSKARSITALIRSHLAKLSLCELAGPAPLQREEPT